MSAMRELEENCLRLDRNYEYLLVTLSSTLQPGVGFILDVNDYLWAVIGPSSPSCSGTFLDIFWS